MSETQKHLGLTDDGWREDAMDRAAKLYPPALKTLARILAATSRYAVEYLEQCPALLVYASYGYKKPKYREYHVIANRFGGAIKRGVKLKEMIRDFGGVYPCRKLKGTICHPIYWPMIMRLRELSPSDLGNMIPEKANDQLEWLRALAVAYNHAKTRWNTRGEEFWQWARRAIGAAMAAGGKHQYRRLGPIFDMVFRGNVAINQEWTMASATAAAERWHAELAQKNKAAEFLKNHGKTMDEKISYGHLPVRMIIDGFEFTALQSGEALFLEGFAMRHCVASYAGDVIVGGSRIYSMKLEGERVATIEFAPSSIKRALYSDAVKLAMNSPLRAGKSLDHLQAKTVPVYQIEQAKGHCNLEISRTLRNVVEKLRDVINGKIDPPPQPPFDRLADLKRFAGVR